MRKYEKDHVYRYFETDKRVRRQIRKALDRMRAGTKSKELVKLVADVKPEDLSVVYRGSQELDNQPIYLLFNVVYPKAKYLETSLAVRKRKIF